jgi:hypothetical protein
LSALNFPSSPTDGEIYDNYIYNATKGVWELTPFVSAPKFLVETAEKTANYTIALADINRVVLMNGSGLTLSIPLNSTTAFPIGSVVNVYNVNSTDLTIAGVSGVTLRNAGALAQYGEISLRKRGTDEWVLAGNVS